MAKITTVELIYVAESDLQAAHMTLQALDADHYVTAVGNEYGSITRTRPTAFAAAELEAKAMEWAQICDVTLTVHKW